MEAFAHFSYHASGKTLLIMDIQGCYEDSKNLFFLSDPAIQSATPAGSLFGPTDMGNHAINQFFLQVHPKCNQFC